MYIYIYIYIADFLKNHPNGICRHLSEKASEGKFFGPDKLQNHTNDGKGKQKKKERGGRKEKRRKKAIIALLVIIMAILEIVLDELLDTKGLFG